MDRGQRHVLTPVKHIKRNFLQKYIKPWTVSIKAPSWMYNWVLNTPLEGFVPDATRQDLAIAPVVECLTKTFGQKCHQ